MGTCGWPLQHQGYVQSFVVEKDSVAPLPVLSESLAMVRDHHDDALIEQTLRPQFCQQLSNGGVHVGDFTVVGRNAMGIERWWRIVRIVRIVKMQPKEEGPLRTLAEPCQCTIDNHRSPALHACIATLTRAANAEWGVVCVKAAIKSWCAPLGVQNLGSHKCCCSISVLAQNLGEIRQ